MKLPVYESMVSRIAIYVIYDKDGIIDQYALYMLRSIRSFVKYLLVVVNGFVNYEGYQQLEKVADEILVRANVGYDITGYKEGLQHISWEELEKYDECILFNSTLMGPFYPLKEMFDAMNPRDIDFWGITKFHVCEYSFKGCKYNYTPEHIQSSFLVIRKSMCVSPIYHQVWDSMPEIHGYEEAIGIFELPFTKEMKEQGFKADVYINTDDLEGYTRYPLLMMADELIINRRCPVMKQKSFSQWYFDILDESIGYATFNAFEYIKTHTDYDTGMIWDNILRLNNMADIKNHMKLNYILPSAFSSPMPNSKKSTVALVVHLYYEEQIKTIVDYAMNMPDYADIFVISANSNIMNNITQTTAALKQKVEIILAENRGRDVSALLVAAYPHIKDYDLVCFVHDKKSNYISPFNNGLSFFYQCCENLLGSKNYVNNIIATFATEPKLGMLMPPPPCHGDYYRTISCEWASDYVGTVELAQKLQLHTNIDAAKPPITPLGTMFWFRPNSLHTLFQQNWKYTDFPQEPNKNDGTLLHFLERIYGIVCQNDGYYSGWVMTDRFSGMYLQNMYFMMREINSKMFKYFKPRHIYDLINRFDTHIAGRPPMKGKKQKRQPNISPSYLNAKATLKKILSPSIYGKIANIKHKLIGP